MKNGVFSVVAIAVAAALLPCARSSAAALQVPNAISSAELAVSVDPAVIDAMKETFAMTRVQVIDRLAVEAEAAALEEFARTDAGPGYAGTWLDESGALHMAASTDEAAARIATLGVMPERVAWSESQLQQLQRDVDSVLIGFAAQVPSTYVDLPGNRVVVEALPKRFDDIVYELDKHGLTSSGAKVIAATQTPRLSIDVVAGNRYNMGNGYCSIGFTVDGGFLTAGHCVVFGATTTQPSGSYAAANFPGDDFAMVRVDAGNVLLPRVNNYSGGSIGVTGSQEAVVGSSVCRSGAATQWRCGTILQRDATVNYISGHTVFGLVATDACSAVGDSGGPFVWGSQAQGIASGARNDCNTPDPLSYYQPVREALQSYHLNLLTTAPPPTPIDHPAFGFLDVVESNAAGNGIRVAGWAMDEDAAPLSTPLQIDISLDTRGTPRLVANQSRPDVAAVYPAYGPNHGFETMLSAAPGAHDVCVFARNHRPLGATNPVESTRLGCRTVQVAPVPVNPSGPIVSALSNLCVDVAGANTANGTAVRMYTCNGTGAQRWTFMQTTREIRALGKCLDISGGGTANLSSVQLWECNGTGAQEWRSRSDQTLFNPQSGRCLDILGADPSIGAALAIYDCHAQAHQRWNTP
jgi:streptogrisin C